MEEFTQSFGFVIFFLIGCLAVNMSLGTKSLYYYLLLVLAGMVFANTNKILEITRRYSSA